METENSLVPESRARKEHSVATSKVDIETIAAYLETDYIIYAQSTIVLRIGEDSFGLADLHDKHTVSCSAFLTAWNPLGRLATDAENFSYQSALVRSVSKLGFQSVSAYGVHPSNRWPGEQSILVLGLERGAAKVLGTGFEQNAIVWCGSQPVPELILLR